MSCPTTDQTGAPFHQPMPTHPENSMTRPPFIRNTGIGDNPHGMEDFRIPPCTVLSKHTNPKLAVALTTSLAVIQGDVPDYQDEQDIYVRTSFRIPSDSTIRHQFQWRTKPNPGLISETIEFPEKLTMPRYQTWHEEPIPQSVLAQPTQKTGQQLALPADTLRRMIDNIQTIRTQDELDRITSSIGRTQSDNPILLIIHNIVPDAETIRKLTEKTQIIIIQPSIPNRFQPA